MKKLWVLSILDGNDDHVILGTWAQEPTSDEVNRILLEKKYLEETEETGFGVIEYKGDRYHVDYEVSLYEYTLKEFFRLY